MTLIWEKSHQKKNTHRFGIIDARKEGRNNADEILQWGNNSVISQVCYNFRCESFDTNFNVYLGQSITPFVNIHDANYPVTIQTGTGGGVGGGFGGSVKSKIVNYQGWSRINKFFTRKFKLELIYRASVHGYESQTWHSKVDGTGPNLVLIKNSNNKVFGGYHHAGWIANGSYSAADPNNFLFQVDENMKFPYISTTNNAVYSVPGYGPTFGGNHDLYIHPSPKNNNGSYCRMPNTNYYDTRNFTQDRFCGSTTDNWRVEEMESFRVIYF